MTTQTNSVVQPLEAGEQAGAGIDPLRWWILAACCVVVFAKLSEPHLWVIGPDFPARAFGQGGEVYRLLANVGTVIFISFQLIGGVLGDLFGRRRVFLIGAIGVTASNMLLLLVWNLPSLAIVRGLAGIFGALVFPISLGMVRIVFSGSERKTALLIMSFVSGLGTLTSLAAIPIEHFLGWRWALAIPIIFGLIGINLSWRYVPESLAQGGFRRLEAIVAAAWTLVVLAFLFGLVATQTYRDWRNPVSVTGIAVGFLTTIGLIFWSRYRREQGLLVALRRLPHYYFTLTLLLTAVLSFALSGYTVQMYQYFFTVKGFSALVAGLALAPILLGNIFTVRWLNRFTISQPYYVAVGTGLATMGVAMILSALVRPNTPYLFLAPVMVLFGLGFLMASTSWTTFFFSALPGDLTGVTAGINRAAGLVGGALSGVVLNAVIVQRGLADFTRRLQALGVSEEQIAQARTVLDVLLQNSIPVEELARHPQALILMGLLNVYRESYGVAIAAALFVGGVVCVASGAIAWVWLRLAPRRLIEALPARLR